MWDPTVAQRETGQLWVQGPSGFGLLEAKDFAIKERDDELGERRES
jgi:hypothetical protein